MNFYTGGRCMVCHCCVFCFGGFSARYLWHRLGCICYTYAQSEYTCASSGTLAQSRLYHTHDRWHTYQDIHEELEPLSFCRVRIPSLFCLLAWTGLTLEARDVFHVFPLFPVFHAFPVLSVFSVFHVCDKCRSERENWYSLTVKYNSKTQDNLGENQSNHFHLIGP